MKEIRDVGHAEVEVEGVQESGVGVDVEAVDPGVGKAGSWWWALLFRKISNGTPPLSSSSSCRITGRIGIVPPDGSGSGSVEG